MGEPPFRQKQGGGAVPLLLKAQLIESCAEPGVHVAERDPRGTAAQQPPNRRREQLLGLRPGSVSRAGAVIPPSFYTSPFVGRRLLRRSTLPGVAIPDFQTIMRPLLVALEDGQERTSTEIRAALASEFSLTETELAEMIPSGRAKTFANRVAWAITHMYQAGLLERPRRSVYRITARGTEVLAAQPDRVDLKILAQFQEYQDFRTKGSPSNTTTATGSEIELISSDQTPEEQIGAAYRSIRSALVADLLERVADKPPRFFERLVLDVLRAMRYGGIGEDSTSHLGQSGDEGVDGVIREDELGLDLIYVQAKRWANPVGRPEIQKFFGALHGKRASKGVFITTSSFSSEARAYADGVTPRIMLVDGHQLARLMVDYGVGVSTVETYELKRVNLDYFADEDDATTGPPEPPTLR